MSVISFEFSVGIEPVIINLRRMRVSVTSTLYHVMKFVSVQRLQTVKFLGCKSRF
jgi:hypothetical protein